MECAICLSTLENTPDKCFKTRCGHSFHHKCMMNWLLENSSCPCCRNSLYKLKKQPEIPNNFRVSVIDENNIHDDDFEAIMNRLMDVIYLIEFNNEENMQYKWTLFNGKSEGVGEIYQNTIYKKKYNILVDIFVLETSEKRFKIELETRFINKINMPRRNHKFKFKNRNIKRQKIRF